MEHGIAPVSVFFKGRYGNDAKQQGGLMALDLTPQPFCDLSPYRARTTGELITASPSDNEGGNVTDPQRDDAPGFTMASDGQLDGCDADGALGYLPSGDGGLHDRVGRACHPARHLTAQGILVVGGPEYPDGKDFLPHPCHGQTI